MISNDLDIAALRQRLALQPEKQLQLHHVVAKDLVSRLQSLSLQPTTMLDLGAGSSGLYPLLKKNYPTATILGFDHCEPGVGKRLICLKRRKKVDYNGEVSALPLPDNSVDIVISNLFLIWLQDRNALLQEIQRILSPQGVFFFSSLGPNSFSCFQDVLPLASIQQGNDIHDIGDELMQTRFSQPVMESNQLSFDYDDVEVLRQDLTRWEIASHLYEKNITDKIQLPSNLPLTLDLEIIYGHAWAAQPRKRANPGVATVAIDSITTRAR